MKKILSIICVVALMLSFSACGSKKVVEPDVEISTKEEVEIVKDGLVDIKIFDVVENKNVVKSVEIENKEDILTVANIILEEINSTNTIINSAIKKENSIYIDFASESGIFYSGSAGELAVLDSLGMTFVEMLGYDNIYYSMDGNEYESGHIVLDKEEPYM